jgi:hypothetical protein
MMLASLVSKIVLLVVVSDPRISYRNNHRLVYNPIFHNRLKPHLLHHYWLINYHRILNLNYLLRLNHNNSLFSVPPLTSLRFAIAKS